MTDQSNESPTSQTPMWFDERPGGTTLTRPIPAQDPGTPSSGSPVRSDRTGARRLSELAVVASLAAVLASGGTYVATRSDAPPPGPPTPPPRPPRPSPRPPRSRRTGPRRRMP